MKDLGSISPWEWILLGVFIGLAVSSFVGWLRKKR